MAVDTEPGGILSHLQGDDILIEDEGRAERSRSNESNRESIES